MRGSDVGLTSFIAIFCLGLQHSPSIIIISAMHDDLPSPAASTSSLAPSSQSSGYPEHVVILYASETGNSQDIAERTAREFRRLGRRCVVTSMDMFDVVSSACQLPGDGMRDSEIRSPGR
jgi:sulfite reductase alpha subunit-like flavoprotein